jgi:hypothetical protein
MKKYKEKYGKPPVINRYKERWAFVDVLDSLNGDIDKVKELLDYYFRIEHYRHPISWFFYNFERIDEMLTLTKKEEKRKKFIREQTAQRVEDWKRLTLRQN